MDNVTLVDTGEAQKEIKRHGKTVATVLHSKRAWLLAAVLVSIALAVPGWALPLAWCIACQLLATLVYIWERWRSSNREQQYQSAATKPHRDLRLITWQEVREHNTAKSLWLAIHDKVYDVTDFVKHHPGGEEVLLLSAGRDVTDLVVSYHIFTDKPWKIMEKYLIGKLITFEHPRYKKDSGFYRECKERVKAYFEKTRLNPKDPGPMIRRTCVFVSVLAVSFYLQHSVSSWPLRILFSLVYGVVQALVLMHVMHDASHTAIGTSAKLWWWWGRISMDWMAGCSFLRWQQQHMIGHHLYPNVFQSDPDLPDREKGEVYRLFPFQAWRKLYKYQYIYLPVLYGFQGFSIRISNVFEFATKQFGPMELNMISSQEVLRQIACKLFWIFYQIVVPYHFLGCTLMETLLVLALRELSSAYFLFYNFVVSHLFPESKYFQKGPDTINEEWAIVQLKTSTDHSHNSWWSAFYSGALNYQVTHHLFPSISQYHLPQIAPIVKEVCQKYGLPYNVQPSFFEAFKSHLQYLKKMGEEGKCVDLHTE